MKDAIEAFENVIAVNPNDADTYFHLGFAYAKEGMNNKAIEALNRAIKLNPLHFEDSPSRSFGTAGSFKIIR